VRDEECTGLLVTMEMADLRDAPRLPMYRRVAVIEVGVLEELARDSAAAWAARQHLRDFLAPDGDLALAAQRANAAACAHSPNVPVSHGSAANNSKT
jgi:hypothetical protein